MNFFLNFEKKICKKMFWRDFSLKELQNEKRRRRVHVFLVVLDKSGRLEGEETKSCGISHIPEGTMQSRKNFMYV